MKIVLLGNRNTTRQTFQDLLIFMSRIVIKEKNSTKSSFQNFVSKTCKFKHKKADTHIVFVEICQKLLKSCKIITEINIIESTGAKRT